MGAPRSRNLWDPEEEKQLRTYRQKGLSMGEIAKKLGRSPKSIGTKCRALNIEKGTSEAPQEEDEEPLDPIERRDPLPAETPQPVILYVHEEFPFKSHLRSGEIGQPKMLAVAWKVDGKTQTRETPNDECRMEVLEELKGILESMENPMLVGHSIQHDLLVLGSEWTRLYRKKAKWLPRKRLCTMFKGAKVNDPEILEGLLGVGREMLPARLEPNTLAGGKAKWPRLWELHERCSLISQLLGGEASPVEMPSSAVEEWDPIRRIDAIEYCTNFITTRFPERPRRAGGYHILPETIEPIPLDGKQIRPRQKTFVEKAFTAWQRTAAILGVAPTGTGKTFMFSETVAQFLKYNRRARVLIIQARDIIVRQNNRSVTAHTIDHIGDDAVTNVMGREKNWRGRIICGTVQTLSRPKQLEILKKEKLDLVVIDEAHHATSNSYKDVLDAIIQNNPHVKIMGVTATPLRHDRAGLDLVFDCVFDYITYAESNQFRWLVKPIIKVCPLFDKKQSNALLNVAVDPKTGDINASQVGKILNTKAFNQWTVIKWCEHARNRKTVFFCSSVRHAIELQKEFKKAKIKTALLTSEHKNTEREKILKRYESGDTEVLINCMVLTEGWDSKATRCVGILRPTLSKALFIQMIGRGLRTDENNPDKTDCLILDMSYCSLRHHHFEIWPDGEPDISGDEGTAEMEFDKEGAQDRDSARLRAALNKTFLGPSELLDTMRLYPISPNQWVGIRCESEALITDTPRGFVGLVSTADNQLIAKLEPDPEECRKWVEAVCNEKLETAEKAEACSFENSPTSEEDYVEACEKAAERLKPEFYKALEIIEAEETAFAEERAALPSDYTNHATKGNLEWLRALATERASEKERIKPKSRYIDALRKKFETEKPDTKTVEHPKEEPPPNKGFVKKLRSLFGLLGNRARKTDPKEIIVPQETKEEESPKPQGWGEKIEVLRLAEQAAHALKEELKKEISVKAFPPLETRAMHRDILEYVASELETQIDWWEWRQDPPRPITLRKKLWWDLRKGRRSLDADHLDNRFRRYEAQANHPTTTAHIHPSTLQLLKKKMEEWDTAYWGMSDGEGVRPSVFSETREALEDYHGMVKSLLAAKQTLEDPKIWEKPELADITFSKNFDSKAEEAWDIIAWTLDVVRGKTLPENFPWSWEEMLFPERSQPKELPTEWPPLPTRSRPTAPTPQRVDWLPNTKYTTYETRLPGEPISKEECLENLTQLENELELTEADSIRERLQVRISKQKQILSQLILEEATKASREEELWDDKLGEWTKNKPDIEDPDDEDLWDMDIPTGLEIPDESEIPIEPPKENPKKNP